MLTPVDADRPHGLSLADISWTPTTTEPVGAICARLLRTWRHPTSQPEVWFFGIVDDFQTVGHCRTSKVVGLHDTVQIQVPRHNTSRIGRIGPYLVFAAGTIDTDGHVLFRRLLLHAVMSTECPLPVESNYERVVALYLQFLGVQVYKPMLDWGPGIRPDFMLLLHRIMVEVQGRKDEEYLQRKERVHEWIRSRGRSLGWRLARYNPMTDTPTALKRKIFSYSVLD